MADTKHRPSNSGVTILPDFDERAGYCMRRAGGVFCHLMELSYVVSSNSGCSKCNATCLKVKKNTMGIIIWMMLFAFVNPVIYIVNA